jgi:hypothetical protein
MTDLNVRFEALQRTVRRLQFTVILLGASLVGLLFMAQAPQNDLSVKDLKAERIVLSLNGKTTTLTGEGLSVESGTKEAGARASLSTPNDGFAQVRLNRWGPDGTSGVFIDATKSTRVYGMSNNGKSGAEMKSRTFELHTREEVEAKRPSPPPF